MRLSVQELKDEIRKTKKLNRKELSAQMRRYVERNGYTFNSFHIRRHICKKQIALTFIRVNLIVSIKLVDLAKIYIIATTLAPDYHNYMYDSEVGDSLDFSKFTGENLEFMKYFISNYQLIGETFIKKYNLLYKTRYYYKLQSVITFLLICKHHTIFPKDIYLLIAKKILFFCFENTKLNRKKEENERSD